MEKLYSQIIDKIKVSGFRNAGFVNRHPGQWSLTNTKPVNMFVGPNNSGKSRLIRYIYNNEMAGVETKQLTASSIIKILKTNINNSDWTILTIPDNYSFMTPSHCSTLIKEILINIETPGKIDLSNILGEISKQVGNYILSIGQRSSSDLENAFLVPLFKGIDRAELYNLNDAIQGHFHHLYIPVLRGLRPLQPSVDNEKNMKEDLYQLRTKNDYSLTDQQTTSQDNENRPDLSRMPVASPNKTIFTGLSVYEDLFDSLLGSHDKREKIRDYELYLSEFFFQNQTVTLIPMRNEDVVHIKIGNQDERPIYDLGDGLQSIVIITFPVFLASKPTQFFIEEPETHLHPGLQRALIKALIHKKEHQYFITTHSNHFVDLAQELEQVTIHRICQKQHDDGKAITYVDSLAKDADLLDDLGVRASSVLLANCSIWVEGITDKLFFRAYMAKYISQLRSSGQTEKANILADYKENLHYIFTEYQGSNITHWNFGENSPEEDKTTASSLCAKVFLIADGDIDNKGNRVDELTTQLRDNFLLLEYKEIENYLPQKIMRAAAALRWKSIQGSRKGSATFDNDDIVEQDYQNKHGIGLYLEQLIKNPTENQSFFKAKSETIKDKVKFCRLAIEQMEEHKWALTPKMEIICERIFKHITNNN